MGFDKKKFLQSKFTAREDSVPVPDMHEFFLTEKEEAEIEKLTACIAKTPTGKGLKRDFVVEKQAILSKVAWKVKGLTGIDVARSNEAVDRNKNIAVMLEALISSNNRDKIQAIKQLIGTDDKAPNDIAKRIELLILGSINPKVDLDIARKICQVYPIEFYQITNKITELTGRGHMPGKQRASGPTQKSK